MIAGGARMPSPGSRMARAADDMPAEAAVEVSGDWAGAIRQRRKSLLQRLGLAVALALIFSPILGLPMSLGWVVGYFAIQLLDLWIFAPITAGKTEQLSGARRGAAWTSLVLNAAYFCGLPALLWLFGGPAGGVCAILLLSGAAIYALGNASSSRSAMLLTASSPLLFLAMTPVFMAIGGATSSMLTVATFCSGAFVTFCLSTWRRMNQAHQSERAARIEAQAKRLEAEQIMAGRSAFLAAIGHDLRTPISAILTGAAELEHGAPDATARSRAHLITDAGLMMKAMLDDLLDHAKLDAGHMTVDQIDFNLRDLLNQTTRLWRAPARAKRLKLRIEGAATIPSAVRGDPIRVRQVLNNLISNAMKFTETGSITLRLSAWNEEPGGYAVLITVEDTGSGMSVAQIARLFTPFDQTMSGISAIHGGTGLGLAISRQLAELMGGRLTVRSRPGSGTSVTLSLSLLRGEVAAPATTLLERESRDAVARALSGRMSSTTVTGPSTRSPVSVAAGPDRVASPDPEPVTDEGEAGEGRPMQILVVDDHDINRRAIQLILQPLGCNISTAADGMTALKMCEQAAFDLIFMDVRMPEMDGREATRRIRAGGGPNAGVPIIAVTADTAADDIAACTEAGMTYFVSKPITPPMLLGAITHVMTLAQADEVAGPETVAA